MSFDFSNGSKFILAGVDDVEKLKSIAGITRIVVEEATELDEAEFNQIDLRLRGLNILSPSITLMFNPVSNNHWLCNRFDTNFDEETTIFLNTTYRDNVFLDAQYIKTLENLVNIDENLYRIYVLNEWGIEDPESLFAKDFKEKLHYTKSRAELYSPHHDVFLCWDFNIQNTCLVVQNPQDNVINVLQEYHIKGYDLEMLANLIKKEYEGHFITINGDAAGHSRSALTSGNATAYDILKGLFGLSWEQFHVPRSNPSHRNSRLLSNLIFKTCNVNIALECVELKNDLISVKVDDSGSMDPYKKKNPNRSHWLDPLRYHFNAHHSNILTLLNK
jgi:phage terminase large subunit